MALEAWEQAWAAEYVQLDPFVHRDLYMVTGIILPIWKHLPRNNVSVRRLKAPSGQRWVGLTMDQDLVAGLLKNLGVAFDAYLPRTAAEIGPKIM
jgi:hypothetical protein